MRLTSGTNSFFGSDISFPDREIAAKYTCTAESRLDFLGDTRSTPTSLSEEQKDNIAQETDGFSGADISILVRADGQLEKLRGRYEGLLRIRFRLYQQPTLPTRNDHAEKYPSCTPFVLIFFGL